MRPQIKLPNIFKDLFSDLRDRRLLPLIGVLAIAIVAVPFALSKSTSPTNRGDSPVAGGSEAGLTIVAGNPGLRDYRLRLRGDQSKDPFLQQYTGSGNAASSDAAQPGTQEAGGGGDGGSAAVSSGGSGDGSSTGTTEPVTPDSGSGSRDDGDSSDGGGPDGGGSDSGGEEAPPTPPADGGSDNQPPYVLSLRVGAPGATNLRQLSGPEPLPSADNSIVTFRGLSADGHKARFDVSPAVSAIFGDAKCIKGTDRCERVEIERGLPVNFVYGPSDRIFRVTVVEIQHND